MPAAVPQHLLAQHVKASPVRKNYEPIRVIKKGNNWLKQFIVHLIRLLSLITVNS